MSKVRSLGEVKAEKAQDCRLWTPLEALKALVRDIEAGEIAPEMVYVAMRVRDPDDPNLVEYRYQTAGAANMELSGLLAQHLHRLCMPNHNDW